MFDLVRLSKLRVAFLRNGVIGVGETNIVNTGFVEGRAVDRTSDVLTAIVQLLKEQHGSVEVVSNGQRHVLMLNEMPADGFTPQWEAAKNLTISRQDDPSVDQNAWTGADER